MDGFKLTSVEEFEQATERLWKPEKVGADSWQARGKKSDSHCKFGNRESVVESV